MDEPIKIPTFLSTVDGEDGNIALAACTSYCQFVCEDDDMVCGQCSGECAGQCSSSLCSQGCSMTCVTGCMISCQDICQICEDSCEKRCQGCVDCESECEITSQNPSGEAKLTLTGGPGELTWEISGLSKPFNTSAGYVGAGITMNKFAGGASSITSIIDYKTALGSGAATSVSHTITYEPGTYTFWGFVETKLGGYWPTGDSATVTVGPAVKSWDWNASNGEATAAQTKRAYTAVTSHGATTDFSYLVWNDLVNKVKETAEAMGDEWNTQLGYGSYTETLMTPSDKVLTAGRFNALRQNIGRHVSTINEVHQGDPVKGSDFITLSEKLNEWIDNL